MDDYHQKNFSGYKYRRSECIYIDRQKIDYAMTRQLLPIFDKQNLYEMRNSNLTYVEVEKSVGFKNRVKHTKAMVNRNSRIDFTLKQNLAHRVLSGIRQ